jgi:shikimate kinase
MKLKLKRTPGIYLVGFMGSGKTTIGRMYAEEIGWRFADLDDDIEAQQRASISDLFERFGEEEFRRIESDAIWKRIHLIRRGMPTVLALGGGAFTRSQNVEMLTDNGITVWIDTELDVAELFERLYYERRSFYEKAEVHVHVRGDDSRDAVNQLLALELLD